MAVIKIPFSAPVANVTTTKGSVTEFEVETKQSDGDLHALEALEVLRQIESQMVGLRQDWDRQAKATEKQLVEIAISVARQALGSDSELIQERVQHFAEQLLHHFSPPEASGLTAFVHPDCVTTLQQWARNSEATDLVCKPDPNLAPGDCRIEADGKGLSASLDSLLNATSIQLGGDES
ncbi:MAG: FliH/SctL family protein [Planctomycetota bacterium]